MMRRLALLVLVSAHAASGFLLPTPRARHTHVLSGRTAGSSSISSSIVGSSARTAPLSWVLRAAADGEDEAPAPAASSGSDDSSGEAAAVASAGAGEAEGGARGRRVGTKRKRVRKDKVVDPRVKERQEDVIRREFDRELVLEEFMEPRIVDRTKQVAPPPPTAEALGEEGAMEEGEDEGSDGSGSSPLPAGLRYDPDEELPVPSEAALSLSEIATRFDGAIATEKKEEGAVDKLPSLAELGKRAQGNILKRQQEEKEAALKELEPIDEYDLSSGILGEGRPVMGIGLPYLQSCHTVVLLVSLLCAFIEFPGFPLTNLPYEYREFLKTGLVVIYFINGVLAFDSIKQAKKRDQSVFFWALKCFVLGALAHNELLLIREKKQSSI